MAHLLGGLATPFLCRPINASSSSSNHNYTTASAFDSLYIKRAAELADKSAGFTAPHPNFGCVIAVPNGGGTVLGEGYLYAEGTVPAEVQAVEAAGEQCRGATAYLNMEPGDCHCDSSAVSALIKVYLFDLNTSFYFNKTNLSFQQAFMQTPCKNWIG